MFAISLSSGHFLSALGEIWFSLVLDCVVKQLNPSEVS